MLTDGPALQLTPDRARRQDGNRSETITHTFGRADGLLAFILPSMMPIWWLKSVIGGYYIAIP